MILVCLLKQDSLPKPPHAAMVILTMEANWATVMRKRAVAEWVVNEFVTEEDPLLLSLTGTGTCAGGEGKGRKEM